VPASAFAGGLRAEYFANPSLEGAPTVTRADPNLDFVWAFSAPDSSLPFGWYSVRWTGTLTVPLRGLVQLGVVGDDGARLYVDGVLVLDRWRRPSHGPSTAPLRLEGGRRYQVRLEYHQNVGAGRVGLVWTRRPAGDARAAIGRAVAAARAAEVAIVVAGIEEGEFRDRASLRLPGLQEDLIREVGATGRPLVVVLVGGSAITMTDWLDQANAVMQVWYPGEEGGHAVADVLTGAVNPSGRLPISFPRAEGQLPLTYFHKPTGRGDDYVDLTGRALFPFGHGLSYSRFTWRAMTVEPATIAPGDSTVVRLRIRNEGPLPGAEVVQVYLRDEVASVTRPVLMLAAFLKVYLEVAEEREVVLPLHADRFALLDAGMRRVIEPGRFIVLAGASSSDLRQRATLDIRGRPD
jgi:beta-glucosidase